MVDANAMPPIRSNRSDEEELLRAGARREGKGIESVEHVKASAENGTGEEKEVGRPLQSDEFR